jgi:FkbM family methyltransferase
MRLARPKRRYFFAMTIKDMLKRVRASQPLNHLTTAALKGLFNATGRQSEFVIKHLPRTGVTSVPLPDGQVLKLDATGEDWIPTQLFWRGWQGYEPELTALFYRLAHAAETVFDVGAHVGFFSLLAGLANPNARVFAFEPLARVHKRLARNVALNDLSNVRCICAAVGARAGTQEFYFPDEDEPVSSSLRSDMLLASLPADTVRHVSVSVVTLDEIVAQHKVARVSLLKLDTERTEHDVLAGGRATLARDRPEIICEVWPDAGNQQQLEDLLRPLGYRFYQLLPSGPAARTEIIGSEQALNYLFTVRPGEIGL